MTTYETFRVTMTMQFPAWDERDGITIDVRARSRAEAIKRARARMAQDGHDGSQSGRRTFRAVLVVEETA